MTLNEKRCTKCGGLGPFQRDRSKPDGLSCRCKACKNAYSTANSGRKATASKAWREANPERFRAGTESWRQKNWANVRVRTASYYQDHKSSFRKYSREFEGKRRAIVDNIKLGRPCLDCGRSFPVYCMDFDHVRGEKVAPVSQMLTKYSLNRIMEEIQKCDLVCANCHRIRTETRKAPSANLHRQRLMAKFNVLKSKLCTDCGLVYPSAAMEFDHLGDKTTDVSQIWSWALVLVEIAKCELVCACCHRKRTAIRRAEAA